VFCQLDEFRANKIWLTIDESVKNITVIYPAENCSFSLVVVVFLVRISVFIGKIENDVLHSMVPVQPTCSSHRVLRESSSIVRQSKESLERFVLGQIILNDFAGKAIQIFRRRRHLEHPNRQ
jgi:hypothetical protein